MLKQSDTTNPNKAIRRSRKPSLKIIQRPLTTQASNLEHPLMNRCRVTMLLRQDYVMVRNKIMDLVESIVTNGAKFWSEFRCDQPSLCKNIFVTISMGSWNGTS